MSEAQQRVNERWPFLVADREILDGAPRFAGTRVPLATLEAHRRAGGRLLDFLDDHPDVSPCDAAAAWLMSQAEMEEAIGSACS